MTKIKGGIEGSGSNVADACVQEVRQCVQQARPSEEIDGCYELGTWNLEPHLCKRKTSKQSEAVQ